MKNKNTTADTVEAFHMSTRAEYLRAARKLVRRVALTTGGYAKNDAEFEATVTYMTGRDGRAVIATANRAVALARAAIDMRVWNAHSLMVEAVHDILDPVV